jgi:hypothetical protein
LSGWGEMQVSKYVKKIEEKNANLKKKKKCFVLNGRSMD